MDTEEKDDREDKPNESLDLKANNIYRVREEDSDSVVIAVIDEDEEYVTIFHQITGSVSVWDLYEFEEEYDILENITDKVRISFVIK